MSENNADWVNDPSLKNIDSAKLQMLLSLASQGKGKSVNEMLPFLLSASSQAKNSGKSFSREETNLILEVLKQGKSPQEIEKMERLIGLIQKMKAGR